MKIINTAVKFGAGFLAGSWCAAQVFKSWIDDAGRAEHQQGMGSPSAWSHAAAPPRTLEDWADRELKL